MEMLVLEIGEVNDPVEHGKGSTAVFVDSGTDVEFGRETLSQAAAWCELREGRGRAIQDGDLEPPEPPVEGGIQPWLAIMEDGPLSKRMRSWYIFHR